MNNRKNILIVCWDFPPHNAIGGRRWAKIAKSLLKLGYNISVITSDVGVSADKPAWIDQNELNRIDIHYLHNHTLANWLNDYYSPFKFLKIRAARLLLSSLFKGTIFDRAIGIETRFLKQAGDIIEDRSIHAVFVTGAPFNLVYYTAKLKGLFPNLKIVADYRDPWINAQNYGMKNLSGIKLRDEQMKQNYVFEHVDYVTAPNPFLLQEIKNTYTGKKQQLAKFTELPHAYDPDDVTKIKRPEKKGSPTIKIVYGGTLYLGIDQYLKLLNNAVSYLRKNFKEQLVELVFYTNELDKASFFNENSDCVKFSKAIGERIFEEIASADFILILLSGHNKDYVTSKYYEFLPYNKPYLYVGPEGYVSAKIAQNGFGYFLRTAQDLPEIIRKNDDRTSAGAANDFAEYTFEAVTNKFLVNISEQNESQIS